MTNLYTDVFVLFFSFPPPLPRYVGGQQIPESFFLNFLFFYRVHSTDFEEKIAGLWTGYCVTKQNRKNSRDSNESSFET